jgi:tetratricopeptide (TPR) repeat protein
MNIPNPILSAAFTATVLAGLLLEAVAAEPRSTRRRDRAAADAGGLPVATAPATFAPLPEEHPLAEVWNDPEFTRRLIGSYGFQTDREPRLTPEEQTLYRDKIVPLLREDPTKAIPALTDAATPGASALFDFTLGNVRFQTEDLTNAIVNFEKALTKHPDFLRAQKNLAFALVRAGRYDEAIRPLARTASLGGADGKVFGLLGFAYMNQGRWVSAEAAYKQALLYEPDNLDFKLGVVKSFIALAQYEPAVAMLDELLQQFPDRDNLWALQANVFIQMEQPVRAALNLEMLRRMDRATPVQLLLLGDLYMAQEATSLALEAYLAGVAAAPGKNAGRALRAAEILVGRSALAEARKLVDGLRTAAGSDLETGDTLRLLKLEAKIAQASGDPARAIATLESILQRNPMDGEALLLAGDHYLRSGDRDRALIRYENAARVEGFEAEGLLKQAQVQVQAQHYVQAVELLRKAQKARPRDTVQRYLERVEQLALRSKGSGS